MCGTRGNAGYPFFWYSIKHIGTLPSMIVTGTATARLERIPDGEAGTDATLRRMVQIARRAALDPTIVATAREVVWGLSDTRAQLVRLFAWVRDNIRYQRDPRGVEWLSTPRRTLEKGHEDCDGKATLLVALVLALGLPVSAGLRAISTDARTPSRFVHVYVVVRDAGGELALDPTYRGTAPGWQYPRSVRRKDVWA